MKIEASVTLKCICCDSPKTFAPEFAPLKTNGEGNYLCGECTRIKNMGKKKIQEEAFRAFNVPELEKYARILDLVYRMFYLRSSR